MLVERLPCGRAVELEFFVMEMARLIANEFAQRSILIRSTGHRKPARDASSDSI